MPDENPNGGSTQAPSAPSGAPQPAPPQPPAAHRAPAYAGPGDERADDEPVARMSDYRALRRKYGEAKSKLDAIEASEAQAQREAAQRELEELKTFKANVEKERAEAARDAVKTKNLNGILGSIAEAKKKDAELIIMGMAARGDLDLYTEGAAASIIEKLGKERPDWFTSPPNGAGFAGGTPGVGLPHGHSLLSLPAEQVAAMSDDQIKAYMSKGRSSGRI